MTSYSPLPPDSQKGQKMNRSQRNVTFWQILFFGVVLFTLNPTIGILLIAVAFGWYFFND